MKPFGNLKVLDLTRAMAGPYASMVLADFGANVIKIESPEKGDDSREVGPFVEGESAYFMSVNRGKRSMTLNLKMKSGQDIFRRMVKKADVVLENYRPGTMEKFGLGYEDLKKINPQIIYAACSGFGHSGPYKEKPAYDITIQAMGGIMSITGHDGNPTRIGVSMGDITAGLFTAIGLITALYTRAVTGLGQKVDVAMLDCQVAILENAIARYFVTGNVPTPMGNRHPTITPFDAFATKDSYIIIAIGNDRYWSKLCHIINREDLTANERFVTNARRTENHMELKTILEDIFSEKTVAEWMEIMGNADIPCSPINTIDQVVNDPQVKARDMIVEIDHPVAGRLKMPGLPIKLSATPGNIERPAPLLGQHTMEILREMLGMDGDQIEKLRANKVI